MDGNPHVGRGWLKAMYLYTLLGAGGTGLGMFFPDVTQSALGCPAQDPVVLHYRGLDRHPVLLSIFQGIDGLRQTARFG